MRASNAAATGIKRWSERWTAGAPAWTRPLNYRHAYHAGNFADLVKHALLLAVVARLTRSSAPLTVFDTHAGAGVYDLGGEAARRSGEAQAGVAELMAAPPPPAALRPLVEAVRTCNGGDRLKLYPGSPWLAVQALGAGDRYVGCELREDDGGALARLAAHGAGGAAADIRQADGYGEAARHLAQDRGRTLLLVDPPYEQADDYARIAALAASRPRPAAQPALIWTPLKDLETFDAFLGRLEAARPASLVVAQVRLHRLDDPMRMNGCAVVLVDAPDVMVEAREVCGWIASRLGGPGAVARVERLLGAAT